MSHKYKIILVNTVVAGRNEVMILMGNNNNELIVVLHSLTLRCMIVNCPKGSILTMNKRKTMNFVILE